MTAAYLQRMLPGVAITLVESARVPTVGVGEATTPMINDFLSKVGLTTLESWVPACGATFKTGILFEDFHTVGQAYWHPFDLLDYVGEQVHTGHAWVQEHRKSNGAYRKRDSFAEDYFPSTTLNVRENRMPHHPAVAFNFDASRFGALLKDISPRVKHVVDDVVDVVLAEDGRIASVKTAEHGELAADFFVDCTGFARRLIKAVDPKLEFESWEETLYNDRALVVHVDYDPDRPMADQLFPYVKCSALSAGWAWSIPLFDRLSIGYVHSGAHVNESTAERELREFCGPAWSRRRGEEFLVHFKSGKIPRLWVQNCAAIGLSGGFVEPLESSGLAITQTSIELLASMLDAHFYDDAMVARYNLYLDKFYADIHDFIAVHYCLTNRSDTDYWRAVKEDMVLSPGLQARLEIFRKYLPTEGTRGTKEGIWAFRDVSWFAVLLGMNFSFDRPEIPGPLLEAAKAVRAKKREHVQKGREALPNHYEYLRQQVYRVP